MYLLLYRCEWVEPCSECAPGLSRVGCLRRLCWDCRESFRFRESVFRALVSIHYQLGAFRDRN